MSIPSESQVWEVWRQDDNGREYLMDVVESEEEARAMVKAFTERGHKQTYWYTQARTPQERS